MGDMAPAGTQIDDCAARTDGLAFLFGPTHGAQETDPLDVNMLAQEITNGF